MDVFGAGWRGHPEAFFEGWRETVADDDVVLVPGDVSWAMRLEEALPDLRDIAELPGRKVLSRGNHDYWWSSIGKVRAALPEGMYALQNDALALDGLVVAGTRGWVCPGSFEFGEHDEKIYRREAARLELSLQAAAKLEGERLVVMLHYPPTNPRREPSLFTDAIERAAPDALVYGHLHDAADHHVPAIPGVAVHFVAADHLGFRPKEILRF